MQHSSGVGALLQRARSLHHAGDPGAAQVLYRQVLELEPDHPEALYLLGTALLQLGQPDPAVERLEQAGRALRNHPGLQGNLARAYFALGRFAEAEKAFRNASRLDPKNVYFQVGVAGSVAMRGELNVAETLLRRLSDRYPDAAPVWLNLGNVLRDQRRPQDALTCYEKAATIDPRLAEAHNNAGSVLHGLYRFDEAERAYRASVASDPDYLHARYNLASVLIDAGRFGEAEQTCREIIQRVPTATTAYTFLGAALGHQGRLHEAVECHRQALEIAPQDPKLVENLAAALADAGDFKRALDGFHRVLALAPDSISVQSLLGNALLAWGRIADGWSGYAQRPAYFRFRAEYPDVTLSRALPAEVAHKHIVLVREQGLGDEIFFLRFARVLLANGARITYRGSNKIRSLIERCGTALEIVAENASLPPSDAAMLLGDLPHALSAFPASEWRPAAERDEKAGVGVFPMRVSVFWPRVPDTLRIRPLETNVAHMRQRLNHAGAAPYIGVTWRAGTSAHEQQGDAAWNLRKEVALESLAGSLRDLPGTFVALQRNPRAGEVEALSGFLGRPVHDFSALNEELENMLAALTLIDEYVGVSSTNMHLRAAAGKPARVLVPCPAEWRWLASGPASPWFPGFLIYRQSPDGDWSSGLAKLRADLMDTLSRVA